MRSHRCRNIRKVVCGWSLVTQGKAKRALARYAETAQIQKASAKMVSIQTDDLPTTSRGHGMFGDRSIRDKVAVFVNAQYSAHLVAVVARQQPNKARELLV